MKNYKFSLGSFSLVVLLAFLIACAASSTMVPEQPLATSLKAYTNFILSVESEVTEDVEKELNDLRGLVLSKVMSLNVFDKVQLQEDAESEEGTLLVDVKITDIRKVSKGTRFWLGAFAGQASMTTRLLFADAFTGDRLGIYTVTGSSGGMGYSGGTSDAVEKTIEAIADIISNNYN